MRSATIAWDDPLGVQYRICRLDLTERDDGSYEYAFIPDYQVLDMLDMDIVGGIPGIDLDLRLEEYRRPDMVPVFVEERSPSRNRVDVWELMESVGLDRYDRFEWMIRTDLRSPEDDLYVIGYEDAGEEDFEPGDLGEDGCLRMLRALASGARVSIRGVGLGYEGSVSTGRALRCILDADNPDGRGPGRRKISVGRTDLDRVVSEMSEGRMTGSEAAAALGISRSTLYRRIGEHRRYPGGSDRSSSSPESTDSMYPFWILTTSALSSALE